MYTRFYFTDSWDYVYRVKDYKGIWMNGTTIQIWKQGKRK